MRCTTPLLVMVVRTMRGAVAPVGDDGAVGGVDLEHAALHRGDLPRPGDGSPPSPWPRVNTVVVSTAGESNGLLASSVLGELELGQQSNAAFVGANTVKGPAPEVSTRLAYTTASTRMLRSARFRQLDDVGGWSPSPSPQALSAASAFCRAH